MKKADKDVAKVANFKDHSAPFKPTKGRRSKQAPAPCSAPHARFYPQAALALTRLRWHV